MADPRLAMFAHPAVPTVSWEPRCNLCRLSRDLPEAYDYTTQALLTSTQTQEEIAAELAARWAVKTTQAQLSRHKTGHLLPDLEAAYETFQATQALLTYLGDIPPLELAQRCQHLALLKLTQKLNDTDDQEVAAKLAGGIAALSKGIQSGERAGSDAEAARLGAEMARLKLATQQGNYEDAIYEFFKARYPHLVPALSQPAAGATPAAAPKEPST